MTKPVSVNSFNGKSSWPQIPLGKQPTPLLRNKFINYKTTPDITKALAAAAPNGVDYYFDNVGGAITDTVYDLLNKHARITLCGQISTYNATEMPTDPRPEGKLLKTSTKLQSFIVSDYHSR